MPRGLITPWLKAPTYLKQKAHENETLLKAVCSKQKSFQVIARNQSAFVTLKTRPRIARGAKTSWTHRKSGPFALAGPRGLN